MSSFRLTKLWRAVPVAGALCAVNLVAAGEGAKVTEFELANGMRGVVIEDRRAPVATHMVWYPVGSADEPTGQSGVAHFLEHMMFRGTDALPGEGFSQTVAENGGQSNAFTSYDYTAYFQKIASDRLRLVMELEADRMAGVQLTPGDVDTERLVVLEERSERIDVDPFARFGEALAAAMFLHHPYRIPLIGWREEIEQLGREELAEFHRRHYAPNNAILVVAGDVDPAAVEALAAETYGRVPAGEIQQSVRPSEPPHYAHRRVEMSDPQVVRPYLRREWLVPSQTTAAGNDAAALLVLADVLGDGLDSRFGQNLVESGVALEAGAYYAGSLRDHGRFLIYGTPAENVSLLDLEAAMERELAQLIETPPTADELDRIKTLVLAAEVYRLDSQMSLARRYGAALSLGSTVQEVQEWPQKIEAVQAQDVQRVARELLQPEQSVTGYLRPEHVDG